MVIHEGHAPCGGGPQIKGIPSFILSGLLIWGGGQYKRRTDDRVAHCGRGNRIWGPIREARSLHAPDKDGLCGG